MIGLLSRHLKRLQSFFKHGSKSLSLKYLKRLHPLATADSFVYWSGYIRSAGKPKVQIAVVGAGTASIFENVKSHEDSLNVEFCPSKGIEQQCVVFLQI